MNICLKCGREQRLLRPACDTAECPGRAWYRRMAESEGDAEIGAGFELTADNILPFIAALRKTLKP